MCGFSVRNCLHANLLAPRIFRWLLEFFFFENVWTFGEWYLYGDYLCVCQKCALTVLMCAESQTSYLATMPLLVNNATTCQQFHNLSPTPLCQQCHCLSTMTLFVNNAPICQQCLHLSTMPLYVNNATICQQRHYLSTMPLFVNNTTTCQQCHYLSTVPLIFNNATI